MPNDAVRPFARRFPRALAVLSLAAALGVACDNGPELTETLQLTAPRNSMLVGQTVQIAATMTGKSGKTLTNRPIQYQSSNPGVAAVSAAGLVTGLTAGSATITGVSDAAIATLSMTVSPVPVSRVSLSRDTATLAAATTLQLTATPLDSASNVLQGRVFTWASSDTAVAVVNSSGLVSAVAPGTATITASTEGKSAQTRVTVTPAPIASIDISPATATTTEGNTVQFRATAKDAAGRVLTGRKVTWTSSDITRATIDTSGLARTITPGTVNILATGGNVFGGALLLIQPVVVASVKIQPDSGVVALGDTLRFTAVLKDSANRVVTTKKATWRSLNTAVATVDTTGVVTGAGIDTTSIVAEFGGRADTAHVRVTVTPLSSIVLTPSLGNVAQGHSGRFGTTLRDLAGRLVYGIPLKWTSSNTAVATVDSTGLITGVHTGTATIFASGGGTFTGSGLYVVLNPVATAPIAVNHTTLTVGETEKITVTPIGAAGDTLTNRLVTFTSSNRAVLQVDADGTLHALKAGLASITIAVEDAIVEAVDFIVH